MNIHFAAFFGTEFDLDIMPFWIEHYKKANFDSYHIFLHKESGEIGSNAINQFKHEGFSVETVSGPYGHGILQKLVLGPYSDKLPPDDFLVIADADEFQSGPNAGPLDAGDGLFIGPPAPSLISYRELLRYVDIVTGSLVDRYTHRLETCFRDPFRQYPYEEHPANEIFGNFTPPEFRKTEWPLTRRTKILAARAGHEVAYEGSHCLLQVPVNAQYAENYKVYHFAWRESAKRKLLIKAYFSQENAKEIFDNDIPQDVLDNRMVPENIFQM
jgi:hypothetical protein